MISSRRWFRPSALVLCTGLLGVAGCGPGASSPSGTTKFENQAPSTSSAPAAPPSAVPNSFDEVAARLDRGGDFYLYLGLAQWLDGLSAQLSTLRAQFPTDGMGMKDKVQMNQLFNVGTTLVRNSGIEQITGVGASCLAVEPGTYRNTFFVHHYKGKETGLLNTLFGTAPHPLTLLNYLPADTAVAGSHDFDLAAFVHTILKTIDDSGIPELKTETDNSLQKFQMMTGMTVDELLASLGSEMSLVLTLDPAKKIDVPAGDAGSMSIPAPRIAILVEVKDDKLFNKVDEALAQVPGIIKTDEPALKLRTSVYPVMPDFELRATVARWDKYLVIASDDHLIRDMIATQKGGAGFKALPLYAKLSAGLPAEGNGFSLTTRAFTQLILDYQKFAAANKHEAAAPQLQFIQKLLTSQSARDGLSISGHVENGWLTVTRTSK